MIIGNGDIAKVCKPFDREDTIIFASGLSDSSCVDEKEFERELKLWSDTLLKNENKRIIYFSTLSIYYGTSRYVGWKKHMERLIKNNHRKYTIIRLGNITWGNNPHTLINFLRNKIKNNEPYEIQDTFRYLCSLNEFNHWMNLIPDFNTEMNITGERISVREIEERIKNKLL